MKKRFLFFLMPLVALLSFSSCGDDEDDNLNGSNPSEVVSVSDMPENTVDKGIIVDSKEILDNWYLVNEKSFLVANGITKEEDYGSEDREFPFYSHNALNSKGFVAESVGDYYDDYNEGYDYNKALERLKSDYENADDGVWKYSDGSIIIYGPRGCTELSVERWVIVSYSYDKMTIRQRIGDDKYGYYTDMELIRAKF